MQPAPPSINGATFEELPPGPQLMASMRSVGYSLRTAIADVIDNSISAGASTVAIDFGHDPHPYIAITDDGHGMTPQTAREAMRLAGSSLRTTRAASDLGRFGLGLKTASLSQARSLIVVSKTATTGPVAYNWSLKAIEKTGRWTLLSPPLDALEWLTPYSVLRRQTSGTIVLWQDLDLLQAQWGPSAADLDRAMSEVRDHIGLVFHRFIDQRASSPVRIILNGHPISANDPFLSRHRATQVTGEDTITIRGETVSVQGYTLPALNKLTKRELDALHVAGTPTESQGFYVYRAKRLVVWGTWFRLAPKSNMRRLTRIRVDVPNSLDDLWSLDVKKSQAQPPPEVRNRLRKMVELFTAPSERVHQYRGRRTSNDSVTHIWNLVEHDKIFRYEINRAHPALVALADSLNSEQLRTLNAILTMAETGLPIGDIFNRLSQDKLNSNDEIAIDQLIDLGYSLRQALPTTDSATIETILRTTEPFVNHPSLDQAILEILK